MRKQAVLRPCLFLSILAYCSLAMSQQSSNLPDVLGASVPLYPPLARAAKVQGTVLLTVVVEGGKVRSTKVVSGHPMLSQAAESNLETWKLVSMPTQTFTVTYLYKLSDRCKGRPSISTNFPTEVMVCSKTSPPIY
jgi:TonB family protein